jgi:hypothetical protein
MTIETLENGGDFVSGIAVLVTLVYLAIQIRTNTKAIHSSNRESVASEYREVSMFERDPQVARSIGAGLRSYPDLSYEQLVHFHAGMNNQSLFFQAVFARHETGQLEDETYEAYLSWYSSLIATPGGTGWFDDVARPIYMAIMVVAVDARTRQGELPSALSLPVYRLAKDET